MSTREFGVEVCLPGILFKSEILSSWTTPAFVLFVTFLPDVSEENLNKIISYKVYQLNVDWTNCIKKFHHKRDRTDKITTQYQLQHYLPSIGFYRTINHLNINNQLPVVKMQIYFYKVLYCQTLVLSQIPDFSLGTKS